MDHANSYLKVGALLALAKQEKAWKEAGAESFAAWLTDLGFSRAWGYACVQVYEKFSERGKGIIPDRLRQLARIKLKPEEENEMLEQARLLNAGAFYDCIREKKGLTPSDGCDHPEKVLTCIKCRKIFN